MEDRNEAVRGWQVMALGCNGILEVRRAWMEWHSRMPNRKLTSAV